MEQKFAILVVDDDVGLTSNLQDILEAEGYNTVVAQNGQSALALCREQVFDLALIDIKLPDISGIKLIEKLAELSSGMGYIISTGYASLETAVEAVGRRDIIAYETKPLNMDHLLALVRQVSERKQVEETLRESEERYRTLLDLGDKVGEAVIMLQDTEQGNAIQTFVSDSWLRITGYSRKALLGMSFFDLVHPNHRQVSLERHKRKMSGETIRGLFEMSIINKDGIEVPIELTSAYTTYRGQYANVAFIRDITERKKMQVQLIQMEKLSAVGTMVAGTAHELLNPMMGILNFAQYCLERTAEDDPRHAVLQDIERETGRCADIVNNLLTFYHIGKQGDEGYQRESLATIIDRVVRLLSYRVGEQRVSLTQHIAEGTPAVWMETSSMQQVFLNLISNALDAVDESEKREVRIEVHGDGKFIQVTVADSGRGIPPENLGKIFDPFFTTKPVGQGTGLGLALSQNIILKHGGDITCQSNPGAGTTFKILLPVETRGGAK